MIKRITDLEEMKRVVEVGDKIEVSDIYDFSTRTGTIVADTNYNDYYNVLFENRKYRAVVGVKSLSALLESYQHVFDKVALIKEIPDKIKNPTDPYADFENSIGCKFKIYVEPYEFDCYCGNATLLNFNPSGQSVFLDKNDKLLIVPTSDIKYMRALKENEIEK